MEQRTHVSKRLNLVNTDNYSIDLEYNEYFAIVHLPRVDKFTKTVYMLAFDKLEELKTFFFTVGYQQLWTAVFPEDETTNKFVQKLGFEFAGVFQGLNVYLIRKE